MQQGEEWQPSEFLGQVSPTVGRAMPKVREHHQKTCHISSGVATCIWMELATTVGRKLIKCGNGAGSHVSRVVDGPVRNRPSYCVPVGSRAHVSVTQIWWRREVVVCDKLSAQAIKVGRNGSRKQHY
jgi:hypothetical protein